jgi:hypothetical protein
MRQPDVYRITRRRAEAAGMAAKIGCHSWRARGITAYLENDRTSFPARLSPRRLQTDAPFLLKA